MGVVDWFIKPAEKKPNTTNILPEIEREREMHEQVKAAYAGQQTQARKSRLRSELGEAGGALRNVFGGLGQMGVNFGGSNLFGGGQARGVDVFGSAPRRRLRRRKRR